MRLLHTSDWHLGRSFHGTSLLDEQAEALNRIVELAEQKDVDLVVIAGDLYDRAIPPAEAVQLFTATLARLRARAEEAIAEDQDPAAVIAFFDGRPPQTAPGLLRPPLAAPPLGRLLLAFDVFLHLRGSLSVCLSV